MNKKYQATSLLLSVLAGTTACIAQTFQAVPFASGTAFNKTTGLSGDGGTIVATSGTSFATRATRWRIGGALDVIDPLANFAITERAVVSFDGEVVAGNMNNALGEPTAFRWTSSGGAVLLSGLEIANNISADGNTVIGYPTSSGYIAQRWTATTGTQSIGTITGTPFGIPARRSIASALTADGNRIFGGAEVVIDPTPPFPRTADIPFVWNTDGSANLIPNINGTLLSVGISDCTPTGDVRAGFESSTTVNNFFRWTAGTGYTIYSPLIPYFGSTPPQITADGSTIIAGLNFWTMDAGVRDLRVVLQQAGCNFTGWTLSGAIGISDDGRTIAGNGRNPLGQNQGWVATIPAPGAAGLLLFAGTTLTKRRRR